MGGGLLDSTPGLVIWEPVRLGFEFTLYWIVELKKNVRSLQRLRSSYVAVELVLDRSWKPVGWLFSTTGEWA